jgi:hypothetical protein
LENFGRKWQAWQLVRCYIYNIKQLVRKQSANHNWLTEVEMANNRFINLLIAIALVVLVGLTAREASATSAVIAADPSHSNSRNAVACASLPARSSIHTVYEKETGTWLPYTEDGPTGIDGGLIQLLSDYRDCSQ